MPGFGNFLRDIALATIPGQAYRGVQDWREERGDRKVARSRRDQAYDSALQQYGPIAAVDAAGPADAIALEGNQREQETAQRGRLLSAQRNAVGALRQAHAQGQDVGAVFDNLAPLLPSLGVSEEQVAPLREAISRDPQALDYLERFLADPDNDIARQRLALESRRLDQGDRRVGQGDERLDLTGRTLDIREGENDLGYRQDRAAAEGAGTQQGEAQAGLALLEDSVVQIDEQVGALLNNQADLGAVLGLPTLRGISRGGLGSLGPPIPGTPAADALAGLQRASSQIRLQAYESLRGAGQITEAESLFGAQAQANLDRIQSPEALFAEIEAMQRRLHARLDAVRRGATAPLVRPSTGGQQTETPQRRSLDDILNQYAPAQ